MVVDWMRVNEILKTVLRYILLPMECGVAPETESVWII
jgi:hypothetical protein